jgi:hypothetical protein
VKKYSVPTEHVIKFVRDLRNGESGFVDSSAFNLVTENDFLAVRGKAEAHNYQINWNDIRVHRHEGRLYFNPSSLNERDLEFRRLQNYHVEDYEYLHTPE